ncbi:MAG: DNA adenine methylase [Bacilli bacterium]|nr:DNA adenine methylase [Bacilli bacterium]MBR3161270.1 DNA adenine methylase [Bacilli bacterium]
MMSNIKPFIKWAGGKEKELPIILKNLPSSFDRYIEPFVGGGAVYLNINCKNSIINDKSDELMLLYKMIKKGDKDFIKSLNDINKNWIALENIVLNSSTELIELYNSYKKDISQLEKLVDDYISNHNQELNALLREDVDINLYNLISEIKKNMISKISRMYKLEQKSGDLSKEDTIDNLECSFKSAYYMYFRYLYNNKNKLKLSNSFYCAVFYFVRDYCYASMFRYNANGEFNVPYGGISYNRKDFTKKIEYVTSKELKDYLSNTELYNLDFEEFCNRIELNENDFMFLDPPYDTEFSTYAKNDFNKNDQVRLANYLKNTKAKFMLVIKNTDFIYNLYNVKGLYIKTFDKKYLVSFMNRNDKDVEHLLITNYKLEDDE